MLERYSRTGLRSGTRAFTCLQCQWRSFSTTYTRLEDKTGTSPKQPPPAEEVQSAQTPRPANDALVNAPRAYGKRVEKFTPTTLSRPIGMHFPPQAGENTGIDKRSIRQRRDDFVNWEKHLARRKELTKKMAKPYFREWGNLEFHKGKTFLAPPRLFKRDKALYFPNLHGRTLSKKDRTPRDTTPVLEGRLASVVTLFSSRWGENQARSFVSAKANPALHALLARSGGRAQLVQVNVEENALKYWLIRLFAGGLRREVGRENWDRYFTVRKGMSDEIRESIGLLNSWVGYTYLVDKECRIRWAGSANAEPEEREALVKGVQKLLDEGQEKKA